MVDRRFFVRSQRQMSDPNGALMLVPTSAPAVGVGA
jgi:hypothetical protein